MFKKKSETELGDYATIKENISQVLSSQLEEDRAIAACLIIRSCNKDKEKVGWFYFKISLKCWIFPNNLLQNVRYFSTVDWFNVLESEYIISFL